MDFEFSPDQLELRDNARTLLGSACPPSLVRAVHEHRGTGAELWEQLVALGWPTLGIPEADGGLGGSFVDVAAIVEELGRVVDPSPFISTVTQYVPFVREAGSPEARRRFLEPVAEGSVTGTLALAEHGRWDPAKVAAVAEPDGDGWTITGTKSHVLHADTAGEVAVVARRPGSEGEDGLGMFVVSRSDATVTPLDVIDPTMPLAEVTFDHVTVGADRVLLAPGRPAAPDAIRRALEEATAAMAMSITATSRAIFDMTVQYAKDRVQFGRPIGSFQALKHRLVEMYLSLERATSVCYFAAAAIAEDDDRRHIAASMAKAAAGDCQRLIVKDGLQLHGGIGFTWDYDLHFWLKRATSGDALFGSGTSQRARLAPMLGLAS